MKWKSNFGQLRNIVGFLFTVIFLIGVSQIPPAFADQYRCRIVGDDWVWFEDHVFLYVTYNVSGPEYRTYQI